MKDLNGHIVNIATVEEKKDNTNSEISLDLSALIKPVKCPSFYCNKFIYKSKMIINENSTYAKVVQSMEHPNINHLISVSASSSSKSPMIKTASSIRVREKVLTICYYKLASSVSTSESESTSSSPLSSSSSLNMMTMTKIKEMK